MRKNLSPYQFYGLLAICLTFFITLLFNFFLPWLLAYLGGINVIAFALYGYDKSIANNKKRMRIPERILHLSALLGGSIGAFFGQRFFHHKTIKGSFQLVFRITIVLQLMLILFLAYLYY